MTVSIAPPGTDPRDAAAWTPIGTLAAAPPPNHDTARIDRVARYGTAVRGTIEARFSHVDRDVLDRLLYSPGVLRFIRAARPLLRSPR